MKFVLFLIKTLSLILCMGLLGAYFYYAFLAEVKSQFMANASLLLFVLSVVVTALAIVLSENKTKSASNSGLDAYLADLRKEEKNTAKHIQNALPKDLLPMLEKVVAVVGENKEAMNTTLLDSKTAFSSALSENKNALSSILAENQGSLVATLTENMKILEARLADNNNSFGATLNNLLEQVTALANKNTAPINMALENINTRLDDLENKIVSNRVGSLAPEISEETQAEESATNFGDFEASINDFAEPIETPAAESAAEQYDFTAPAEQEQEAFVEPTAEVATPSEPDTSGYDFSSWNTEPAEDETEPTVEDELPTEATGNIEANQYDFTALSDDDAPVTETVDEPVSEITDEPIDFDSEISQPEEKEPDMAESVSGYADNLAPNEETDQRNAFDDDLSSLADLEIMQEPVAPTAEPQYDEIDIDEFLKGRTDVKN